MENVESSPTEDSNSVDRTENASPVLTPTPSVRSCQSERQSHRTRRALNREHGRGHGMRGRNASVRGAQDALRRSRQNRAEPGEASTSRSRSRSPDPDDPPSSREQTPTTTPRGRRRTSLIWKHCKSEKAPGGKEKTVCNYCPKSWELNSSTSTALQHLKAQHLDKIADADIESFHRSDDPTSPDASRPSRASRHHSLFNNKIIHNSYDGRRINCALAKALISGSVPLNILDNVEFAIFCEELSGHLYNLPSRTYMNSTVIPIVYNGCKKAVLDIIKKVHHISLTTDAWRSFSKRSYITVTAHLLDDDLDLHTFALNTSEIKKNDTRQQTLCRIFTLLLKNGA